MVALRRFRLDARSSTIRARRRAPPPRSSLLPSPRVGPALPVSPSRLPALHCGPSGGSPVPNLCANQSHAVWRALLSHSPVPSCRARPRGPLPVGHCACFWGYEGDPCSRCWSPRERNHYTHDCITGDSVALPQDFVNLPPNSPQRTSIHSAGRKRGGGKDILGLPWVAGRWRRVEESAGTSRCHRASPKRKLTRVG